MTQKMAIGVTLVFGLVLCAVPALGQDSMSDKFDGLEKEVLQGSDDKLPAWDPLPERERPREPIDPIKPGDPEIRNSIRHEISALKSIARKGDSK